MTGGPFRFTDRAAREAAEEQLAPAATRAAATRGRVRPEAEDPLRGVVPAAGHIGLQRVLAEVAER